MKQFIVAATLIVATLAYGGDPANKRYVNIGNPDALEQLSKSEPETFAKVQRILREIDRQPMANVKSWMKTNFGADDVVYSPMLRTSDPAKRHIAFTIGDTQFGGTYKLAQVERLWRLKNAD